MPRPKQGYLNAAGQPIPGTHDPIKRFQDGTALRIWSYNQGKAGKPLWDRTALDIGSIVHKMAEMDMAGSPERDVMVYATNALSRDDLDAAMSAYRAFKDWRERFHVSKPIAQEIALVSEKYQYGGTPDIIALIGNRVGLLDFKTSKEGKVYPDQLVAMAAHGRLWNENHPGNPITDYHLIMLPKDGSGFQHHAYSTEMMKLPWKIFKMYLKLYPMDKILASAGVLRGQKPSHAAKEAPVKPAARVKPTQRELPNILTIGELLRAYGHVGMEAA